MFNFFKKKKKVEYGYVTFEMFIKELKKDLGRDKKGRFTKGNQFYKLRGIK